MSRLLFALFCTFALAGAAGAELPSATTVEIDRALAAGRPAVIDLGARSCVPCKAMAPILEDLASAYKGRAGVLFIDVRQDQAAAKRFGIQMIPTQIFFDAKGNEVSRHIGFLGRDDLIKGLQAAGMR